jgi:acyl-CoA dehydrogenase
MRMRYLSGQDIYSQEMLIHAKFYRELALEVDHNPSIIKKYLNHPSITKFLIDMDSTCLERTKMFESLSYGDVGVLMSAPGPSLSGLMIRELGNEQQKEYFYQYLQSEKARTFLAVTEPARGSDAANLTTHIIHNKQDNKYYLNGEKCFVGNGAVGEIGVVIARLAPGPLGMVAVMISPGSLGSESMPSKNIIRKTIPTVGLHGASLSHLVFNQYEIDKDQILGAHLRIFNRGLVGLLKTFNRMRTCVGALAIGLSQAILDYAYEVRSEMLLKDRKFFIRMSTEIAVARKILYEAASSIDFDVTNTAAASMAKVIATHTAEKVVSNVFELFEADVFFEHPLVEKWHRDVYGFEFMEGTMQIHYKNIAQKYALDKKLINI